MTRLSGSVPPLDLSVDFIASMGAVPLGLAPPVTVKGTARTNIDIGSGYAYAVMVDTATLQK